MRGKRHQFPDKTNQFLYLRNLHCPSLPLIWRVLRGIDRGEIWTNRFLNPDPITYSFYGSPLVTRNSHNGYKLTSWLVVLKSTYLQTWGIWGLKRLYDPFYFHCKDHYNYLNEQKTFKLKSKLWWNDVVHMNNLASYSLSLMEKENQETLQLKSHGHPAPIPSTNVRRSGKKIVKLI